MEKALVTGAPGFLGSNLVRALLADGVAVRAMALHGEALDNLEGLDVEVVRGDVLRRDEVQAAVRGCDTVFHAAAIYKDWVADPTRMYDVNLGGTFHVLEAARRARVRTVVCTASMVAVGRPDAGRLANEETPFEAWDLDFAYGRSKYLAKRIGEWFAEWGLDVRTVCPGILIGPGDIVPTPSGKLILGTLRGEVPGYTVGGANYVDVRDVARAHIAAVARGKAGGLYLATAYNLTTREFLEAVCKAAGIRRKLRKIPTGAARAYIKFLERKELRAGREPKLGLAFFDYGLRPSYYDNWRARNELGVDFRPIEESIADAVAWFRERGVAP